MYTDGSLRFILTTYLLQMTLNSYTFKNPGEFLQFKVTLLLEMKL